jgi:hypothetical protein
MDANTDPCVVRRTRGVGTPAAWAASWNAVAARTSSSDEGRNGTLTAQLPCVVSRRQTWPCLPLATGPSDSLAPSPSAKRLASVPASIWSFEHAHAPAATGRATEVTDGFDF